MTLYIANSTRQVFQFHYREPINGLVQMVAIGDGRQVEIGHGWTAEQKRKVIAQLEAFGGRNAAELNGNMGSFHGISYRSEAVVKADEIAQGHEVVVDTQTNRSVREATRSALGFDRAVRTPDRGRRAKAKISEVEVVQELPPYERPTGTEVNFHLTVDPEGRQDVDLAV